jgi:transcription-repair coupling factor (superfamily II helicase)
LKDYFDEKINQLKTFFVEKQASCSHHIEAQIESLKEATVIAKSGMEERLAGMNEFRSQLKDQAATFAKGESLSAYIVSAGEEIKNIRVVMEKMNGDLRSLENSFNTANVGLEKRLETMNEFRSQLKDQASGFFTRNEHDQFAKRVDEDVRSLRESRAALEAKADQAQVNVALLLSSIGTIIGIVGFLSKLLF